MTNSNKVLDPVVEIRLDKLEQLRKPFKKNQIGKLPRPTKAQTEAVKEDYRNGFRCPLCKGWHHPDVQHLDYVGHAAVTDRLLEVDPCWNWEPLALTDKGQPVYDPIGGLWIKLTIQGVTRLGYGNANGKEGGDAIKEVIGDAIRNAAMRFGVALDLWHKGELHTPEEPVETPKEPEKKPAVKKKSAKKKAAKKAPQLTKEQHDIVMKYSPEISKICALGDPNKAKELWNDINPDHTNLVWGSLSEETQNRFKDLLEM